MHTNAENSWIPNKWIAATLALLFLPLGMLYVASMKWAIIYFFLAIILSIIEYLLAINDLLFWGEYFSITYLLMIVCAIHAYYIAKSSEPTVARPWFSRWYGILFFPIAILILVLSFRSFLYEPFRLSSTSMFPTIKSGEVVIVQKWGYGHYGTFGITLFKTRLNQDVARGDIIVFEYPKNPNIFYAKRVVGLPGDSVLYQNKQLFINGKKVNTELLANEDKNELYKETLDGKEYQIIRTKNRPVINRSFIVPEKSYFVFGDNRDHSNDSRYWGGVPEEAIIGKVVYLFK